MILILTKTINLSCLSEKYICNKPDHVYYLHVETNVTFSYMGTCLVESVFNMVDNTKQS